MTARITKQMIDQVLNTLNKSGLMYMKLDLANGKHIPKQRYDEWVDIYSADSYMLIGKNLIGLKHILEEVESKIKKIQKNLPIFLKEQKKILKEYGDFEKKLGESKEFITLNTTLNCYCMTELDEILLGELKKLLLEKTKKKQQ
jgi:hypothetical protein